MPPQNAHPVHTAVGDSTYPTEPMGYGYGYSEPTPQDDPYTRAAYPRTGAENTAHIPSYQNSPYIQNYQYVAPAVRQKSKLGAILLLLCLGEFGAHNFYLGNIRRAQLQLALTLFGMVTFIFVVGGIVLSAVCLWLLYELVCLVIGGDGYDTDGRGIPLKG